MKIFTKRTGILIILGLGILCNLSAILFSLSLMRIIDSITETTERLHTNIFIAVLFLLMNIVFSIFLTIIKNRYTASCTAAIKANLVNAMCEMPVSEFAKKGNEYFESFFINDLKVLEEQYIRKVIDVVTSISQFVLSIVAIAILKPIFLLLPVAVVFVSIMTPIAFKGAVSRHNRCYSEANSSFLTTFGELLSGFIVIKNFSVSKLFTARVNKAIVKTENSYASYLSSMSLANIAFAFTGQLLLLLSFAIGGTMAAAGIITAGTIVYLSQLLAYIIEPLAVFAGAATSRASVKSTLEACAEILSYKSANENLAPTNTITHLQAEGDISVENLRITIPEANTNILDGITMTLHHGKKYALIGKNGSGKSTLLKALSGIFIDYSGEIRYNNIEIKGIQESLLNSVITYSPQDNFVFSMNIYENIFLRECEKQEEQAWATKHLNKLKLLINPNQTISGSEISGGERAKICLLRSLVRNSPYLFLDEPTAAMDEYSCSVFDEIIQSLNDVLCVVVTHRIDSSLRNYDSIVVLDSGRLIAIDNYDNLLTNGII